MDGLRSAMKVNVTARLPKQHEPWPENSEEILLGTDTRGPTGFAGDPMGSRGRPGSMPITMAGDYDRFAGVAPQLARRTSKLYSLPLAGLKQVAGLGLYEPQSDSTVFFDKPTPALMGHETLHRMQMQNFGGDRAAATKAWNPRGKKPFDYLDAPGEQQAFKVEELIKAKQARQAQQARKR
jgi:hypothetical protein